jgi:hypothetical protein
MADVAAIVYSVEVNLGHGLVGAGQSLFQRGRCGADAQHAASAGEQLAAELG